jgi:hypothetical protein
MIFLFQSWNRYSPLPQPGFGPESLHSVSSASSLTDVKTVVDVDPYDRLSLESKRVVDSVVGMGFPKARTARAVERLGADQKEVQQGIVFDSLFRFLHLIIAQKLF